MVKFWDDGMINGFRETSIELHGMKLQLFTMVANQLEVEEVTIGGNGLAIDFGETSIGLDGMATLSYGWQPFA